jgi:hypothetical protein
MLRQELLPSWPGAHLQTASAWRKTKKAVSESSRPRQIVAFLLKNDSPPLYPLLLP